MEKHANTNRQHDEPRQVLDDLVETLTLARNLEAGDRDAAHGSSPAHVLLRSNRMNWLRMYRRLIRRRRVGSSYDMAKEIAPHLPDGARTLDVGCGSGFIAHHLGALLGVRVQGIDVGPAPEARIPYCRFDGGALPFVSGTFDAVLFCYVLHHAADARLLLTEAARVLTPAGRLVIYEDTPRTWLDRLFCRRHERRWLRRTGRCTFRHDSAWRQLFSTLGLNVTQARPLSRLRDPAHPVARSFYVLQKAAAAVG